MDKLCVDKLCVSELCVSELCVSKLCVKVVWEEAGGGGRRSERGSAQPKKQEPHTKMWGKT